MKGATMIPATTERVIQHTPSRLNEAIAEQIRASVARHALASPQMLEQRLRELDHEWDVERITSTAASLGLLAGMALAVTFGTVWLIVPALIALSLLLHAVFGWSPALPVIRQLGVRTMREIDHERYALKALRGDFQPLALTPTPQDREAHARFEDEGGPPLPEAPPEVGDPAIVNEAVQAVQR
jgi:hypothetical protein